MRLEKYKDEEEATGEEPKFKLQKVQEEKLDEEEEQVDTPDPRRQGE
jgi:hypothetical protein